MKEEKLDNIFRAELGQHDSGTPEHLWAGIEARRKKPNRTAAWWVAGAALFLVVGLPGWYLLSPDSVSTQEKLTVETPAPIADATSAMQLEREAEEEIIPENQISESKDEATPIAKTEEEIPVSKRTEAVPKKADFIVSEDVKEVVLETQETQIELPVVENSALLEKSSLAEVPRLAQLKSKLLNVDLQKKLLKGPDGCYSFDGRNGPLLDALSFDLIGGPGIAMRTLENTGDSEQDFYLTARDSTESAWYEFGATLRANFRYTSGLVLRGGVNYSQINEIFEIRDGDATRTIITEIRDAEGNVIGTETTVEEGELHKKTHNRLRFVDIPIMLGYEWTRNKWTFAINAGPSFNLRFRQKGDFLSENLEPVTFTTDEPDQYEYFKTKIGINYIGSVGMSRQLTNKLDFHVEPQIRYMPNSISDNALEQRYTNVGVYAGLRYYFVCRQRN